MIKEIKTQSKAKLAFYIVFAALSVALMTYYLSNTIIHYTTPQQFPINSFSRFPLSWLIFPAEIFSFLFALYFVYNLVQGNNKEPDPEPLQNKSKKKVAILLPVYNEPEDIVRRTLEACQNIRWRAGITIYLLDDSTNEDDKDNMEALSEEFGCVLVRRTGRKGYKAGNINNAIRSAVKEEFFVIFDSDQAPEPEFLEETMDHFSNPEVGFVQVPQHFINTGTPLERAASLGTNIFYHSLCVGKSKDGAMAFCGTNAVIRTAVFKRISGFAYYTATEDIELGLRINEAGYKGVYVPKILVHGYAPVDYNAYASQQYRWANGNLAILRESWLKILLGKFSFRYQVHTFFTLGWWVIGITTMLYIITPLLSFKFGGTHHTWLPSYMLAFVFLNVIMGIGMIYLSLKNRIEGEKVGIYDAFLQYSLITNSMFIYTRAAINALFKRYAGFVRTNKKRTESGFRHIRWNLLLAALCFAVSVFALLQSARATDLTYLRTYLPVSIWMLFYSIVLTSSVLFVGKPLPEAEPLTHKHVEANKVTAYEVE